MPVYYSYLLYFNTTFYSLASRGIAVYLWLVRQLPKKGKLENIRVQSLIAIIITHAVLPVHETV